MYIISKYAIIIQCFFLFLSIPTSSAYAIKHENDLLKEQVERLKHRLKKLEPTVPDTITDPPWETWTFPTKVLPTSEIIKRGTNIPFDLIVDKPDYQRPIYDENWHSSVGRWSYVPVRVHYALHRLFTTYDIGLSGWYDFEHQMGISIPMFQDEKELDLYIVAFQTKVMDVFTIGNHVVVVGVPQRNGVQVITISTGGIKPFNKEENILVQLTTMEGHEIDYSLISYVPPDFWKKQKEKLRERNK